MWAPEQCLPPPPPPPPLPEATIINLLTLIDLPELLSLHQLNTRAAYHSMYMLSLPPNAIGISEDRVSTDQTMELVLRAAGQHFPSVKTINEAGLKPTLRFRFQR